MHVAWLYLALSVDYSFLMLIPIVLLWIIFGGVGLEIGYHRSICHKQFEMSDFTEKLLGLIACFSLTGSPTFWKALHVGYHHPHSDSHRDFHSPVNGGILHAYWGYINQLDKMKFIGCRDMISDKFYSFINGHYKKIIWLVTLFSYLISPETAFVLMSAMLLSFHQAATVNAFCHASPFGYRNFETKDLSKNIRLLSYFTFGQALHNNHHARPGSANYAYAKGEYDIGLLLSKLIGLKVRVATPQTDMTKK
jgi:stearoyl-CoA desaturase (delta-9 desaturase)